MLVLSRKEGETILIGDDIVITALKTKGKKVTLGFNAPNSVRILRAELAGKALPPKQIEGKGRLVISCKEEESVLIGDNIVVIVNKIKGNNVSLGFEAPRSIKIDRAELRTQEKKVV